MKKFVLWFPLSLAVLMLVSCQDASRFVVSNDANLSGVDASINSQNSVGSKVAIDYVFFPVESDELILDMGERHPLFLSVDLNNAKTYSGITKSFRPSYKDVQGDVVWYSNNSRIVAVSAYGELMAMQPGSTTIIASLNGKSAAIKVTVNDGKPQLQDIAFSSDFLTLTDTKLTQLYFDVLYEQDETSEDLLLVELVNQLSCQPELSSSNESIVAVTDDGDVIAFASGEARIDFICGNYADSLNVVVNIETLDEMPSDEELENQVVGITITSRVNDKVVGSHSFLSCSVELESGEILQDVTSDFSVGELSAEVQWSSSNNDVVRVDDNGRANFVGYGEANVTVSVGSVHDEVTFTVKSYSEQPDQDGDVFLGQDDRFEDVFTADSGFGLNEYPDILYGPPGGSLDVVSFGTRGELIIELNGYVIVDGVGPDFTIFENPFPGWQECADVSVSTDGEQYYSFECQSVDSRGVYPGCAGVHSVAEDLDEADYLNPDLSGGDIFDLGELPVVITDVRFIQIRHIGFCATNSQDAANGGGGDSGGFDLDAMAILNGRNE